MRILVAADNTIQIKANSMPDLKGGDKIFTLGSALMFFYGSNRLQSNVNIDSQKGEKGKNVSLRWTALNVPNKFKRRWKR